MNENFYKNFTERVVNFLNDYAKKYKIENFVLGLSGGIDSTVVAYLLSKTDKNIGKIFAILPYKKITPNEDISDAIEISKILNIPYKYIEIDEIVEKFKEILKVEDKRNIGNIIARVRMIILYSIAQSNNGIVIGTGDKSEIMIGYFTKYGDGGCDLLPIGDLFKTEVRELARYLKIPEKIISKKSSPQLWKDQTAEGEMGIEYEKIDIILREILEGKNKEEILKNFNKKEVEKIFEMYNKSEHKRNLPLIFKTTC